MSDEPKGPAGENADETDETEEVEAHGVEIEDAPELGSRPFLDINFGCS